MTVFEFWGRLKTWEQGGASSVYTSFLSPSHMQGTWPGTSGGVEGHQCSHRQWYNWAERRSAGNIRPTPTNTFSLAPRHLQQQRPSKSIQPQPRYRMCMTRRRGGPAGRLRNNVFSAKLKNQPRLLNSQNQGCTEHHYERCWALLWSRWNFCSEKVNIFISEHI